MNSSTRRAFAGCRRVVRTILLVIVLLLTTSITVQADGTLKKTVGLDTQELHTIMLAATSSKTAASKPAPTSQKRRADDFDHLLTGFSLFGSHVHVECESCHIKGIFRGTPTTCDGCHGRPGSIASTFKPFNHINTQQPCDICHNSVVWSGARFDHATVAPGSCLQCHNGSITDGKPATGHPVTSESCEACHSVGGSWFPANFRHIGVTPGTCLTCHCVTATCKPGGHQVTSESCDVCHKTTAWLPASGHGTGVAPGSCKNCHSYASGHFSIKTAPQCDDCHYDNRWTPLRGYNHMAVSNHSSSINNNCDNCHKSNTDDATWSSPTYKPNCAGCHQNKWRQDPHKKYGDVRYTLTELQDCTTSCHIYSDATMTPPPVESRPGRHTILNGRW
ncbi:MAG: hypothetical protein LJE56_10950 [Acidiferrobacterales bacterium]|jgi:hypothetical protein|nr:hypothetical protein [Acidiferrobacterales bacterium]